MIGILDPSRKKNFTDSSSSSSSFSSSSSSAPPNKKSKYSTDSITKPPAPTSVAAAGVVKGPGEKEEEVYCTAMRPLQYDEIDQLSKYKFKSNLSAGDMGNFSKTRVKRLVRMYMYTSYLPTYLPPFLSL